MFSLARIFCIVQKEFIQVKRDKTTLLIIAFMPIFMMFLFGYAVNTDVSNIKTVVLDYSKTSQSRDYLQKFAITEYFTITSYVSSEDELEQMILNGSAKAGIIIPPDYANKITLGESPNTRMVIDGTDPSLGKTALNSGVLINEIYSKQLQEKKMQLFSVDSENSQNINMNVKIRFNPELKSSKFSIPGLIGLIIQNITIMLTAFSLVKERELGTMEQLIVTPVRSFELIIGKLIPNLVLGYLAFLCTLVISLFWFGVSIKGNISLLMILGLMFVLCSLSVGMFISTFSKNQFQAMMNLIYFVLPSILLSGYVFPRETMPAFVNVIGYLMPLTYFMEIIRGIVLKGVGYEVLQGNILALFLFLVGILSISVLRVKKNLE